MTETTTTKQIGRPRKNITYEDSRRAKNEYSRVYNECEIAKEARRRYCKEKTRKRQMNTIIGKFSEDHILCENVLKHAIQNEDLLNILRNIIATKDTNEAVTILEEIDIRT
jgi:hypothetical protein